ncbi:hypothetical protein LLG46_03740 [bacterium]|nr:hypothetical protein [bacterium]
MSQNQLQITEAQKRLLQLMQEIHYGKVEDLVISDGEPVMGLPVKVLRDVKLSGESSRKPILADCDNLDKPQVVEMLRQFRRLGDGVVQLVEIHDGLPFRIHIVDVVRL